MAPRITYGRPMGQWSIGDLAITRTRHRRGLELATHDHEAATMVVVLNGDYRETIGTKTFECARGAVVVKPSGAHHSDRYDSASVALLVALSPRHVPSDVGFVRSVHTAALASRLDRELEAPDAAAGLLAEGLVLELMGMALRATERDSRSRPEWLRAIVEHLHAGDAPSLESLAAAVARHPAHVAREFRRHFGCSPGDYHRALRLERASDALRGTHDSLAEIATAAGFYDQSHFTNAFRRQFGITPARYRSSFPIAHRSSKTAGEGRGTLNA